MRSFSAQPQGRLGLLVICVATAGWAFSFGVGAPLAALWLAGAGCSDSVTGANTGSYYLAMAGTAAAVPWLMRRLGRRCAIVGMALSGVTAALFPWGEGLFWWFLVRCGNGAAGALSVIPLETHVNRAAKPAHRARDFGFYAVALTLGYALGNWVGLELYPVAPRLAFAVGGGVSLLSALLVACCLRAAPEEPEERQRPPLELRRNLLSYGSAWNQGFLEGVMITFLPLYLLSQQLTAAVVGWMTSLAVVGVLLFQLPVAWLADRLGRTAVLLGCYAVVLIGLGALPGCGALGWLALWLFAVGACSGAFYPLGLALLGERLPDAALARANACYLAVECAGCIAGPVVTGCVRDWFGPQAMFPLAQGALVLFLLTWAALSLYDRRHRGTAAAEPNMREVASFTMREEPSAKSAGLGSSFTDN